MKVCVIGLRGIPDVPGGIETHCENLYERIVPSEMGPEIIGTQPRRSAWRFTNRWQINLVWRKPSGCPDQCHENPCQEDQEGPTAAPSHRSASLTRGSSQETTRSVPRLTPT